MCRYNNIILKIDKRRYSSNDTVPNTSLVLVPGITCACAAHPKLAAWVCPLPVLPPRLSQLSRGTSKSTWAAEVTVAVVLLGVFSQ